MIKIITLKSLASIFIFTMFLSACTDVDKTLGVDMVPENQKQTLVQDTIYPNVYNVTLDSLLSSTLTFNSFGSCFDPVLGTTTTGMAFQVLPIKDSIVFESSSVVDSIVLELVVKNRIGDDSYDQTVKVYELSETLKKGDVYTPKVDMSSMINANPLASYSYKRTPKDKWDVADTLKIRLDNSLGNKLLAASKEAMIKDSVFFEYFKGLYITTEPVNTNETGRINQIAVNLGFGMTLHYKNKGKDTICTYVYNGGGRMSSFTSINHDYLTATHPLKVNVATLNDTLNPQAPDTTLYVNSLFGVTPVLKIRESEINAWLSAKGLSFDDITIARVLFEIDVEKENPDYSLDMYPNLLGLFYKGYYKTGGNNLIKKTLHSLYAINEVKSDNFGGSFNKTLLKYTSKITRDFSHFFKNMEKEKEFTSFIAPMVRVENPQTNQVSFNLVQDNLYRALFKGSRSASPPRLIITYSKTL